MGFKRVVFEPKLIEKVMANLETIPDEPTRFRWKSKEFNSDKKMGAEIGVTAKVITRIRTDNNLLLHNEHFDKKGRRKIIVSAKVVKAKVAQKPAPKPEPVAPVVAQTALASPPAGNPVGEITRKNFVDLLDRVNQLERGSASGALPLDWHRRLTGLISEIKNLHAVDTNVLTRLGAVEEWLRVNLDYRGGNRASPPAPSVQ